MNGRQRPSLVGNLDRASGPMIGVLRHLRQLALPRNGGTLTDGQLLERFLATRDEAAFEAIVRRHGPMVLGVCRRVLHSVADAEDAFQATFLVLVHKSASVARREAVGSWLYGVAYRTASKARVAAARRRVKEMQMARPEAQQEPDDLWRELRPLLDQELNGLPEKYRAPVVLCDLQGQTRKQAAEQLGCPEGTVSGRLARARHLLAKRLARHGIALSSGAFATALSAGHASACVRAPLVGSTTKAATLVAAGHVPAGVVSAPVAALTAGVLKSMGISKLKLLLAALLAIGMTGIGWGVCSGGADDNLQQAQPPAQVGGGGGAGGRGAPAITDEKIDLPTSPAPVQVLASIDANGKLVIKRAILSAPGFLGGGFGRQGLPGVFPGGGAPALPAPPAGGAGFPAPPGGGGGAGLPGAPAAPGGGGGAGLPRAPAAPGGGTGVGLPGAPGAPVGPAAPGRPGQRLLLQTYDLDKVEVLDTKGKKLDRKEVQQRLKQETVALATWSSPFDPLHLRVVKDGTLVFVLPRSAMIGPVPPNLPGLPGAPGGAVPPPPALQAVPPGVPEP